MLRLLIFERMRRGRVIIGLAHAIAMLPRESLWKSQNQPNGLVLTLCGLAVLLQPTSRILRLTITADLKIQ